MSAERLLQQFDVMVRAPNGAQKLRELVLQLAVRGQLAPQGEHRDAVSARASADADTLPKPPFGLPRGWTCAALGQLGEFHGGGTPSKSDPSLWAGGIPWVSPKDMKRARISDSIDHVSESALSRSAVRLIPSGALLMVVRGMILARSFPVAIAERPLTVNQDMKALVPHDPRLANYLLLALRAFEPRVLASVERSTHGTCRLESSTISALVLPVPPLDEQQRIVAKVDELMALCDELEARERHRIEARSRAARSVLHYLTRGHHGGHVAANFGRLERNFEALFDTPESIAALRLAVRHLAVRGRLVPHEPGDAPAADLLAHVAAQRERLGGGEKPRRVVTREGVAAGDAPFSLPAGWVWSRLGDLIVDGPRNGYSPKPVGHPTETRALTLSATTSGTFDARHFKYIDEVIPPESEYWLKPNDLLFQRGNTLDYVGTAAVYDGPGHAFIYPDLMIRVRCADAVSTRFVQLAANSFVGRAHFASRASGTSGSMPKISQQDVLDLPVPVPPRVEQDMIVKKVDELLEWCDRLEAQLTHARARATQLASSLVAHLTAA